MKTGIVLVLAAILNLVGFVHADVYFFSVASGNWATGSIWNQGYSPSADNMNPHHALLAHTVDVTSDQGSGHLSIGYGGQATVNVVAGADLLVDGILFLGHVSGDTGILNLYGTAYAKQMNVGHAAGATGRVNIYDSGYIEIGSSGCNVGTTGSGFINLRGNGSMIVDGTFTMGATPSVSKIDIQTGQLSVLGDHRTQLQGYINNGRIVAYSGAGTVNAPTYSGGYTTVTAVPQTLPTTYFFSNVSGSWATGSTWNTGTVPIAGSATSINHALVQGHNITVTSNQGSGHLSIGYTGNGNVNVSAGKYLHVDYVLFVGHTANTGTLDLYGTTYARQLVAGNVSGATGTVNVYNGGNLQIGTQGCNIGVTTGSVGRINLKGNATMTVMVATGISMGALPAYARIDIEAGYLKVVGNQVAQLQSYINNGRITGYNGVAAVAAPVYTGGYTIVAVYPASAASAPNPTNALLFVPLNKTLTWTAGQFATGHDVYWGTNSTAVTNATRTSPEYKGNFNTASYQNLDWFGRNIGQTHYWRVDETSGNGAIVRPNGYTWSFHTEHVIPPLSLARGISLDRHFQQVPPESWNTIEPIDVKIIRYMGFDFAKVLIDPGVMISGDTINMTNMLYVDEVMNKFMSEGVPVVICIHPMPDFKTYYLGNATNFTNLLLPFYEDFAGYLAARWGVNELAFQLMTEPFGNYTAWNSMWPSMLSSVRAAMPDHTLIMSGDQTGTIAGLVNDVNPDLTADTNIYWSFTTYDPFAFTLQGAGFWDWCVYLNNVPYPSSPSNNPANYILPTIPSGWYSAAYNYVSAYCNTPWNMTQQRAWFQSITNWQNAHPTSNPKVWCAEFGSIDRTICQGMQGGGPNPPERIQFIADRRQAMEERGISWAYWSYNETFTVLEPTTRYPYSKDPTTSMDLVDDEGTLVALAVRSPSAVYFWSEQSGNWADPNTWDLGVPHTGNSPGHDVYVVDNVTVSNNQGSTDLHIGYAYNGTIGVSAGATLSVDGILLVGQSESNSGVLNLYGSVICNHLHVGDAAYSAGTITVYGGGYLQVNNGGCDVGTGGGTALIDLESYGYVVLQSPLTISATGRIDIESSQIAVLGDCRTQLQGYINNGRITGYDGTGTVNAPTFSGGFTRVTANP